MAAAVSNKISECALQLLIQEVVATVDRSVDSSVEGTLVAHGAVIARQICSFNIQHSSLSAHIHSIIAQNLEIVVLWIVM